MCLCICSILFGCKKTYEDGPYISLRTKKNRITGKWKLVSMEGLKRLNPDVNQYMELFDNEVTERDGEKVYKASFDNFQSTYYASVKKSDTCEFCWENISGDSLFSATGTWAFHNRTIENICNDEDEELSRKEGLSLSILSETRIGAGSVWKIKKLTKSELVLFYPKICILPDYITLQEEIQLPAIRLCFEKVE